ncbi:DNA-binding protein HU homolog [Acanthopagrus latus]|uniref:DNA-binding protein HU homolog n=1 Tax=Acanthopagrus latus TaxID=8177 RepID=UPI00187BFB17|nr:DNA-binding protein HU homolog [Acanthopagrus latus]
MEENRNKAKEAASSNKYVVFRMPAEWTTLPVMAGPQPPHTCAGVAMYSKRKMNKDLVYEGYICPLTPGETPLSVLLPPPRQESTSVDQRSSATDSATISESERRVVNVQLSITLQRGDGAAGSKPQKTATGSKSQSTATGSKPQTKVTGSKLQMTAAGSKPSMKVTGSKAPMTATGSKPRMTETGSKASMKETGSKPGMAETGSKALIKVTGSKAPMTATVSKPGMTETGSKAPIKVTGSKAPMKVTGSKAPMKVTVSKPAMKVTGSKPQTTEVDPTTSKSDIDHPEYPLPEEILDGRVVSLPVTPGGWTDESLCDLDLWQDTDEDTD